MVNLSVSPAERSLRRRVELGVAVTPLVCDRIMIVHDEGGFMWQEGCRLSWMTNRIDS